MQFIPARLKHRSCLIASKCTVHRDYSNAVAMPRDTCCIQRGKALVYLLTILATTISILSRLVESHPLYYVHRSWISSVHVLINYKSLLHLFVPLNLRLRSRQSMDLIYQLAVSDLDCLVFLRMFRLFPVLQAHKTFGSIQLWLWSLRKSQQDILNKIVR